MLSCCSGARCGILPNDANVHFQLPSAQHLTLFGQGLPGASPEEAPLRVVRLGPLDAVHESVRALHLDNLSSRSAKEDHTLAAAKGAPMRMLGRSGSACVMNHWSAGYLAVM